MPTKATWAKVARGTLQFVNDYGKRVHGRRSPPETQPVKLVVEDRNTS